MFNSDTHLQVFSTSNQHVGHFDGEFFYPTGRINLRVDGGVVYSLESPARCVGHVTKDQSTYLLKNLDNEVLYELRE